ncbi:MAG: imidazole glycerol phosphate synthase subunit HisH, partial [Candidatus Magasanikbacteria bacterium]|nr:imidazole glycerol phosphate synthase subunit HisH [Candidatus Magasanikbacteria bacterium]
HSYILEPSLPEHQLASTAYGGYSFCSAIQKGRIFGVQFHPEKSGAVGLRIISNFVTLAS